MRVRACLPTTCALRPTADSRTPGCAQTDPGQRHVEIPRAGGSHPGQRGVGTVSAEPLTGGGLVTESGGDVCWAARVVVGSRLWEPKDRVRPYASILRM